ncbi:uncharacterized protein LAJ45_11316 [Morchella importuna]|uniref:uncharacterized protein n=1 Tax=Morchella importuna TaxID=1174673 RepID=UPI001E8CDF0C|nr:uncharacterized protein LAJ45_11316 [Morchella importuna]KAH8144655.1 hypothetical protein LAJ45_11316 [Morchella importuna]
MGEPFLATGSVDIIDKAITLAGELVAESTSFKVSGLEPLSLHMKQLRSDPINPSSRIEPDTDSADMSHPDRPAALSELGSYLNYRYLRFGGLEDLKMSIAYLEEAVTAAPTKHPYRPAMLNNSNSPSPVAGTSDPNKTNVDSVTSSYLVMHYE